MRSFTIGFAVAMALGLTTASADAQSWKPPSESQRCPSKWGANDLRAKKVHEFAFVMQPLKAQGLSGSTVAPVAIR